MLNECLAIGASGLLVLFAVFASSFFKEGRGALEETGTLLVELADCSSSLPPTESMSILLAVDGVCSLAAVVVEVPGDLRLRPAVDMDARFGEGERKLTAGS